LIKYDRVIIVSIENLKSTQIHDIRKHLRGLGELLVAKKSFLQYLLKNQTSVLIKKWLFLKSELKQNIGLIFTDQNPKTINVILKSYYSKAFAISGDRAQIDIKIKKGNKGISPSQTPFFQALGIPTRVSKGSIEITDNILLVRKNQLISESHEALLKKLNLKPFKYGMLILKIFINNKNVDTTLLYLNEYKVKNNINLFLRNLNICLSNNNLVSEYNIPWNIYFVNKRICSILSLFVNNN